MNAFLIAGLALIVMTALPAVVMIRARPIEAIVALEVSGTTLVLAILCLCEGFHRSTYFNLPIIAAAATWISGLIFVRFVGRFR